MRSEQRQVAFVPLGVDCSPETFFPTLFATSALGFLLSAFMSF